MAAISDVHRESATQRTMRTDSLIIVGDQRILLTHMLSISGEYCTMPDTGNIADRAAIIRVLLTQSRVTTRYRSGTVFHPTKFLSQMSCGHEPGQSVGAGRVVMRLWSKS